MSNYSEVQDVMVFLKQRYVSVSPEWVEACINFLKQEHAVQNLTAGLLKDLVYQQWLIADLEEICVPSLPSELATTQKITLNGSYALQVNGIRDVGKPAYAQLKELDNQANSNAEFSAAPEAPLPPWETKPTRMLMLNLTDGCSTVQGMEYKQISFLSKALAPGIKVLIQGPVDCRFGVFLLTPEKIKVLGGEVESKLEQYSQKSILKEILNIPVSENEASDANISDGNNPMQQINEEEELNSISILDSNSNQQNSTVPSSFRQPPTVNNIPTSSRTSFNSQLRNPNSANTSSRLNRKSSNCINNYFSSQLQTERQNRDMEDNLDGFEDDDDFVQSLDYGAIDELERENNVTQVVKFEDMPETEDIWNEDEDVLRDVMAFQDENPSFNLPFENPDDNPNHNRLSDYEKKLPFTYLSSVPTEILSESLVTIKGFIIKVLSKLECTLDKGWNLNVKINDGSATVEASIHDKALESIIGISASEMVKMQKQAAQDQEKRKEVMEAISKCKTTLQDYNCLMDIKFSPNALPCIMKFYQFSELHIHQLFQRVKSYF